MLAKRYRFHSRGGVKYTYQKGRTVRSPKLALIHAPNTRKHQRFGVVVSKKILKSAVGRNRIRRRLFEAIRLELPNFTAHKDCLFVVYDRSIKDLPFTDLRHLVHDLLTQSMV